MYLEGLQRHANLKKKVRKARNLTFANLQQLKYWRSRIFSFMRLLKNLGTDGLLHMQTLCDKQQKKVGPETGIGAAKLYFDGVHIKKNTLGLRVHVVSQCIYDSFQVVHLL